MTNDFMTVVVRNDLKPGYKCAQSVHAMADFAVNHEQEFKNWQKGSNYLCCLEASELKMIKLKYKLDHLGIKYHEFKEPDMDYQTTAIAVESLDRKQHKEIFKTFKLTLS